MSGRWLFVAIAISRHRLRAVMEHSFWGARDGDGLRLSRGDQPESGGPAVVTRFVELLDEVLSNEIDKVCVPGPSEQTDPLLCAPLQQGNFKRHLGFS